MTQIILRDYQIRAQDRLRESIRRGNKKIILQAPTGSGKTIIAADIIKKADLKGSSVLFLCHRRELIFQSSDKLDRAGVPHGILMAGEQRDRRHNIQVASIQTLYSRSVRLGKEPLPPCRLMLVDECHGSTSKSWRTLINSYPDAILIGLTATPCRSDGAGLGHIYDDLIVTETIEELTKQGHLVPVRYFAPSAPDLEGVRVRAGDYVESDLEARMDVLMGDIVENWQHICPDRKTVVFATTVRQSRHIAEQFRLAGVRAVHLDANSPKEKRADVLQRLAYGDIQLLSNVGLFTHGTDLPPVSCAILARPTKSLGLYVQICGRVLRTYPGKDNCIVIDHSGAVHEHGFIDEPIPWTLDTEGSVKEKKQEKRRTIHQCKKCHATFEGNKCTNCGDEQAEPVIFFENTLKELRRENLPLTKRQWWCMLEFHRLQRNWKRGWTSVQYKERFGVWPIGVRGNPVPPNKEVMRFIRSKRRAFLKSQKSLRAQHQGVH